MQLTPMKHAIMFAALLLILAPAAHCQDILQASLRWNAVATTDLRTNQSQSYECAFVSGPGQIKWLQKGGQSVKTYIVQRSEGSWNSVAVNGTVVFYVTEGPSEGTVTFQRSESGLSITLDFSASGPNAIKRRFSVFQVQTVD